MKFICYRSCWILLAVIGMGSMSMSAEEAVTKTERSQEAVVETVDEEPAEEIVLTEEEKEITEAAVARPVTGEPIQVYGWREYVEIKGVEGKMIAKLDTGARTSSIHAEDQELFERDGRKWVAFMVSDPRNKDAQRVKIEAPLARVVHIKEPGGISQPRQVVKLGIQIGDRKFRADFTLNNRSNMLAPVLIGRTLLMELGVVDPGRTHLAEQKILR